MIILFLCTGNSCRSILAEATFNALAPIGMKAISAGSQPAGYVHSKSIALLLSKGITSEGYYSKSWDNLPVTPNIVITVCSNVAGETCPAYLGKMIRAHWGVKDPAKATGTDEEIDAAFELAYLILRKRIEAFLKLPALLFDAKNEAQLQAQLNAIGEII
jgi:arsenate reductase